MTQFANHLNILTDSCKETIEQMTRLKIKKINVAKAAAQTAELPFAHMIAYTDYNEKVDGNFILSFEKDEPALNLASAISERLGLDKFEEICEDSTDLLNEFLNIVVGRTISEWDNIGLKVKFGTPVFKKKHKHEDSKNVQAYTIKMDVIADPAVSGESSAIDRIVLRVDLLDKSDNKIKNKKILLVEDSRVMRKIIAKVLKKEGAEIQEAENGEEAIKVHKTFNPDLTLMDINMPIMNGLESIIHIKEFHPNAKFIILSSSSRKDEIITAKTLNASGYLIKPVDPEKLIKRVSDVL